MRDSDVLGPVVEELEAVDEQLILVAGGGGLVDEIRRLDTSHDLPASLCHWAAIRCMDINGEVLASRSQRFVPVSLANQIESAWREDEIPVLLPHDILKEKNPLPVSWAVTSDSISVWAASYFGLDAAILLKQVKGITQDGELRGEIGAAEVRDSDTDVVDPVLPQVIIRHGVQASIVSSRHPGRVASAIRGEPCQGTLILPEV